MEVVKTDKLYMQLNSAELEAIRKRDSPSSNDRDAGFCSASSESEGGEDLVQEHPPLLTSSLIRPAEDYGAVKEGCVALVRNKRKSMEPLKVVEPILMLKSCSSSLAATPCMGASGPLKKRIRYTSSADSAVVLTPPALLSPLHISNTILRSAHAWDPCQVLPREIMPNPAQIFVRHPGVTTLHRSSGFTTQPEQQEPLALVTKKLQSKDVETNAQDFNPILQAVKNNSPHKKLSSSETLLEQSIDDISRDNHNMDLSRPNQRNYKNMTRERRIEANARERTRVHTISAAYETLRHAVPAYASSQKLSKLSVLRVACSYILTLSRMAGMDYSSEQSEPNIADCIEAITATIQTEGKAKRKKEE